MYVTALKVRASDGRNGINAFLHLHRELAVPLRGPGEPDLDAAGGLQAGYMIAHSIEVTPGGNDVQAHLDIAGPDDATTAALAGIVGEVRALVGRKRTPIVLQREGIAIRFGTILRLDQRTEETIGVLDSLWESARKLLARRDATPAPVTGPLVVWAEPAADGVHLFLPPPTLARLPSSVRRKARVLIPAAAMAIGKPAELLCSVAAMLLDLDDKRLLEDGLEVIEPRTGIVLAARPPMVTA